MEKTFAIGRNIKMIQEIKGISQQYMADQLKIGQKTYSNLEAEKSKFNSEIIQQIADVLEIDPIKLLSFNEGILFHQCNNSRNFGHLTTYHEATGNENDLLNKTIQRLEGEIKNLRQDLQFLRTIMEQMISNKKDSDVK